MPYLGPTLTHVDFTAAEVELVQRQQHRSWLRAGAGSTPSGQEYQWGAKNGLSHLRRSLGMGIDHVTIARILSLSRGFKPPTRRVSGGPRIRRNQNMQTNTTGTEKLAFGIARWERLERLLCWYCWIFFDAWHHPQCCQNTIPSGNVAMDEKKWNRDVWTVQKVHSQASYFLSHPSWQSKSHMKTDWIGPEAPRFSPAARRCATSKQFYISRAFERRGGDHFSTYLRSNILQLEKF